MKLKLLFITGILLLLPNAIGQNEEIDPASWSLDQGDKFEGTAVTWQCKSPFNYVVIDCHSLDYDPYRELQEGDSRVFEVSSSAPNSRNLINVVGDSLTTSIDVEDIDGQTLIIIPDWDYWRDYFTQKIADNTNEYRSYHIEENDTTFTILQLDFDDWEGGWVESHTWVFDKETGIIVLLDFQVSVIQEDLSEIEVEHSKFVITLSRGSNEDEGFFPYSWVYSFVILMVIHRAFGRSARRSDVNKRKSNVS